MPEKSKKENKEAVKNELSADQGKLKEERDEYLDGWKRAKADLVNYKKDELKRLEEIAKFANEDLIRDLIEVIDSFELAIEALKKSGQAERGIYLILSKLEDKLRQRGLEKIEVKKGDKFDPSIHDAISVSHGEDGSEGLIAEEMEAGYTLNGKIIRAAKVRVYD